MNVVARYRGGALAMVLVLTVIVCSQIVTLPIGDRDAAGFSLVPEGSDVARLSPIVATFPQAPTHRDGASLLQIFPSTAGSYAWLTPRKLLFQPDFPGLIRGTTYTAIVPARGDAGLPSAVTRKFTVTGKLAVQQVIPGDKDVDVPLDAQVFVQFSRSVAPLTTLAAQPTDTVVTFDPPLHGKGEWLNTSIYRFLPDDLLPDQTYQVTVKRGVSSAVDGVLEQDFRSSFRTVGPAVDSILPDAGWIYGGPWQEAVVTFNQAMNDAAGDGVTVANSATGAIVPGTRRWNATHTVLTFSPSARMANDMKYVVTVAAGLKSARGGVTAASRTATFTVVGVPRVSATFPKDGETNASQFGVSLQFNAPMDPDTLEGKLSISGFTDKDLAGKVNAWELGMAAGIQLKPRTRYTATLAPGAIDRYGQVMGGYTWSFTTASLPSSVSLALPSYGGSATYSSSSEPFVWYSAINTPTVTFRLYPLTAAEARDVFHDYKVGDPRWQPSQASARTWTERVAAGRDEVTLAQTSLSGGGPLPKGAYLLATNGGIGSRFAFAVVDSVIVTKLSTTELLAWALDHDSGRPLAGVTVHVDGNINASAVTDARGLATFDVPKPVVSSNPNDRSYYLTIGGARNGVVSTRWQGMSPYQFGLSAEFYAREWVGHIYSDRPIYRPGETVFYKGVVRADDDAAYSLPPKDAPIQFLLTNSRGQQLARSDVTLDDFGSFAGFFDLPKDAPTGNYSFAIQQRAADPRFGYYVASNTFLVSEFRKPEFQVDLTTDRASYVSGDVVAANTAASYFFGGALDGAAVDWSAVIDRTYTFRPKDFPQYAFSDIDYYRTAVAKDAVRAKGNATTAADGSARFSVPAVLNAAEGPQRFSISASVQDQSGQSVGATSAVTVHPASLYAGIRSTRYVVTAGLDATLQLVTVDTDGVVLPRQRVVVRVYDRQWMTTKVSVPGGGRRYQSEPRDVLLDTLTATTDATGKAELAYTPARSGQLRIVAEVTDAKGRTSRAATYLWANGQQFALWQVTNDDSVKLVADKDRYAVGDTAEVLVPAPFAGATALVTIERGKIITREVRTLPTNSERLRIPITDRSVPNVYVSVVLYRGPTTADPLPRYKVGYIELPVSTETRHLDVKITPNVAQAKPGQTVHYDIKVTDSTGKGVRSQVSVAVVDKAVLSLQEDRGPDGLLAFWFERGLAVTTTSSMTNSLDRWNDVVAELPKVGKGGGGSGGQNGPRQDFRNTAYWDATLVTKDDGTAGVDVAMPDDLTTWRLQARAISGDTLVGEATNELVSTKPLLIRSALPRFVRVGDKVDLRILVRNALGVPAAVSTSLKAEGLTLDNASEKKALIGKDASVAFSWPAKITSEGTVKLTFTAATGGADDSMSVTLPAYIDLTPEVISTNGVVTKDAQQEAIYLPKFADTAHGSLAVSVRSALVGTLADELIYFKPHQYENAEYVASRLIATIGVARAEKSAHGTDGYAGRVASDIAGLIGRQRPDGGWAWCDDPRCASDPNVTGWALLALGEARRDGKTIDGAIPQRASNYLYGFLNRPNTSVDDTPNSRDQKAFLLAAMSAAGTGGVGSFASALFEQDRAVLASWGRGYLVNAFLDSGSKPDDEHVRALINDLSAKTIPSANGNHWEDAGNSTKYSFMTSTSSTALVALAIARAQPDHQLLAQSVRWLVVARQARGWATSIDRAMSVLALTTYASLTNELGASFGYKVSLDDGQVLSGLVKPTSDPTVDAANVPLAKVTPGKTSLLSVSRDATVRGRLYYSLDLRYQVPAQNIDALNRGFAVSHTYTLLDAPGRPVTSARLGDTVRVTVTVIAPNDRNYVTVDDLLPAGLEPIDARLQTVDAGLRAKLDADVRQAAQKATGGYIAPWFRWYYTPWQQVDLRDDRATLRASSLGKGIYEYVYYARATTPGAFFVAPAHAEEAYFPEVFGRSDSSHFTVTAP